jgi:hypothetical protein
MIRSKQPTNEQHIQPTNEQIVLDLTDPDGNAYALCVYAFKFARQLDYSQEEIKAMTEDMMSSDYEHLVRTFDRHFGTFVILER